MYQGSTSGLSRLRQQFHSNPVGFHVELPDGSLAVVKSFLDDSGERLHRVVGVDAQGRFCKLPDRVHHWYTADELILRYWTFHAREVAS